MSTESTELTFIRCPACRSLVPAVSSRCRMCGAPLDGVAPNLSPASFDSGDDTGAGRVRQRTMSENEARSMATAVEEIREEHPIEESQEQSDASDNDPFEDPLRAYLEGNDDEEAAGAIMAADDAHAEDHAEADDGHEANTSIASDETDEAKAEKEFMEALNAQQAKSSGEVSYQPSKAIESKEVDEVAKIVEEPKVAEAKTELSTAPRVIVESGRRAKERSKLSFGKREASAETASSDKAPPPRNEAPPISSPREMVEKALKSKGTEEKEKPASVQAEASRRENAMGQDRKITSTKPGQRKEESSENPLLYGWLVSFEDDSGTSIELREGRFFVSCTGLRPRDIVFDHPSVSTPHALFVLDEESGVQIQDLTSEKGVYVKRSGEAEFERHYETTSLNHGDVIRFGELDFTLALVPVRA